MDADQLAALIGAAVLGFVIRVFNTVVAWLARVLDVEAPEPIPTRAGGDATMPSATPGEPTAGERDASRPDTPGDM